MSDTEVPGVPRAKSGPRAPRDPATSPARARAPRLVQALAVVVALLVTDVALGTLLTGTGLLPGQRGELVRLEERAVPRGINAPAMRSAPWAAQYIDDFLAFDLSEIQLEPYIVRLPADFQSRYINIADGERRSYQPTATPGVEPLRVAFFGGSTMFGVGQRDEHTIPSALARLAEMRGVPLEVHNYGMVAWVSWQEVLYLERLLSAGERYDLVVFYDGSNDFDVQENFSVDPTHAGVSVFEFLTAQYQDLHQSSPGFIDGIDGLLDAYRRASGAARIYHHLTGGEPFDWLPYEPPPSPHRQAEAALGIHARAMRMAQDLARDHGVSTELFWQPRKLGWDRSILDGLPPDVTDISGVFGTHGDQYYLDKVHTNEAGARMVARAMWDEIGPRLEHMAEARG